MFLRLAQTLPTDFGLQLNSRKAEKVIKNKGSDVVLPLSLSDLFSCSVSVRVSTELERLDRHELLPEVLATPPRPHSLMARSGDITAWLSASMSGAVPTEKPR